MVLQGDKIVRRVSKVCIYLIYICVCVCVLSVWGGTCPGYFGLASLNGVLVTHVLGDLASL